MADLLDKLTDISELVKSDGKHEGQHNGFVTKSEVERRTEKQVQYHKCG